MADSTIDNLTEITAPDSTSNIPVTKGGVTKKLSSDNFIIYLRSVLDTVYALVAAVGNVLGPASNTDGYVPQWNGADSKLLKNGLSVVTTVGATGADTALPTEQAVREALTVLALMSNTIQIEVCWPEKPLDSGVISLWPPSCTIPANLTGATYHGVVDPAAEAVVTLKKNGTSFGTATVAAGSTDVMTGASTEASFNGTTDRLDICFPDQDADWSGVAFKFQGARS